MIGCTAIELFGQCNLVVIKINLANRLEGGAQLVGHMEFGHSAALEHQSVGAISEDDRNDKSGPDADGPGRSDATPQMQPTLAQKAELQNHTRHVRRLYIIIYIDKWTLIYMLDLNSWSIGLVL